MIRLWPDHGLRAPSDAGPDIHGSMNPGELSENHLRHRRVTTWLADGKSAALVREAKGHADLRTTLGYSHLAKEHLRALVEEESSRGQLRELGS